MRQSACRPRTWRSRPASAQRPTTRARAARPGATRWLRLQVERSRGPHGTSLREALPPPALRGNKATTRRDRRRGRDIPVRLSGRRTPIASSLGETESADGPARLNALENDPKETFAVLRISRWRICRAEEGRVGKEGRSRLSAYHSE